MKKFYTLLAAAAVTVSASALTRAGLELQPLNDYQVAKAVCERFNGTAPDAYTRTLPTLENNLEGMFFSTSKYWGQGVAYDLNSSVELAPVTTAEGGIDVVVKGMLADFFENGVKDVTGYFAMNQAGTKLYLVIPYQELATENGKTYQLMASGISNGRPVYFSAPEGQEATIDFEYVAESNKFIPAFAGEGGNNTDSGVAAIAQTAEGAYGIVTTNYSLVGANATFTYTTLNQANQEVQATQDLYVSTYFNRGRFQHVAVQGLDGYLNDLILKPGEGNQLIATDCVAGDFYVNQDRTETEAAYYTNDITFTETSFQVNSKTLTATHRVADGCTEIELGETSMAYVFNVQDVVGLWFGGVIKCNVDLQIPNAAIEGVSADVDANAPVEFFNIQGQRIDNPANGQLVIRRQGSKVEKLIVR